MHCTSTKNTKQKLCFLRRYTDSFAAPSWSQNTHTTNEMNAKPKQYTLKPTSDLLYSVHGEWYTHALYLSSPFNTNAHISTCVFLFLFFYSFLKSTERQSNRAAVGVRQKPICQCVIVFYPANICLNIKIYSHWILKYYTKINAILYKILNAKRDYRKWMLFNVNFRFKLIVFVEYQPQ